MGNAGVRYKLKSYVFVIRTTERCEVGCAHCSISARKTGEDQPLEVALQAIDEVAALGVSRIHLSGGEPLLFAHLPKLVRRAAAHGLISGITSSTFTKASVDNRAILDDLKAAGIDYVMLSFDDPHGQRVPIEQFCEFVKRAQECGIEVCVFITQQDDSQITEASVKEDCRRLGIDVGRIDWTVTDFQFSGRGERFLDEQETQPEEQPGFPRCPIVLSAATLNPDGRVFLCNCSRFEAEYFTIGKYPEQSMAQILASMEQSPLYRYLAKHGPQQALQNLGQSVPSDMCQACERYLTLLEDSRQRARVLDLAAKDDLEEIEVDFEGLLPIYQRHMHTHGEKCG